LPINNSFAKHSAQRWSTTLDGAAAKLLPQK
jgi:hypothetical protein